MPRTSRTLALAIASVFLSADLPAQVIAGRVIDDRTQQPAVDYVVRLVQTSDRGVVALDETTTDPKGHFTVVAPSAGRYLLSFGRSALRVHRVAVDVEAGAAPTPKDFPLPIQRESDMQPYVDVDVDSARIMTSAGGPAYPNERRQVGEGGSTFAIFVVDTTGHPEINSLRVFAGTHADFARSVEQWLTVGTFGVSHVGNVPVRRQVCLAVSFQLDIDSRRPRQVSRPSVPPAGLANSAKALCSRAVEGLGMITVSAQR